MSPTQRTLKKLRKDGYTCAIVEKWNQFAKIRQDLFGFIDILAIRENEVCGIQACHISDIYKRIKKIREHKNFQAVRDSGIRIIIHGWGADGDLEEREIMRVIIGV